jgi:uncharacterized protein
MTASAYPFVWHDLITTDTVAAKAFYAQVFGWSMQAFPGENEYTVISAGSTGVGGIMPIPAEACERGAPACWQGYIAVPDVDVWAARIQAKGGATLQAPQDIPNVGRFAVVADLHGAAFIIFKPKGDGAMPAARKGCPAPWAGMNFTQAMVWKLLTGTQNFSDGARFETWIWGRWACTDCFRQGVRMRPVA